MITSIRRFLLASKSLNKLTQILKKCSHANFEPINLTEISTEVRPIAEAINQLFRQHKETFQQYERFSGDAAHELRTPLAALKTQAQVALRADSEEDRKLGLKKVIEGADRCTHIVQQLLALSRFGSESILGDMHHFDLSKFAIEITAQLAPFALKKNIEIEFHEPEEPLEIYGNETALSILIRNLIDNAIRYTPEEGEIHIYVRKKKKHIVLSVLDNGAGILPELRSRVFERFYRVLGSSSHGSGLGLAIVKQIAELHDAKVKLRSSLKDQGLAVHVFFKG
jgi:two-component system sensor histidine kinase QseC